MSESNKSKATTLANEALEGKNSPKEVLENFSGSQPKIDTNEQARVVPVPPPPEKPKGKS
jgi:hypothetical protein